MRASPAVQASLQRFGVWQSFVAVVVLLGSAALLAWLLGSPPPAARIVVAVAAFAAMVWAAWHLVRTPASILRWDGQRWSLARLDAANAEPLLGELHVAIDLGPWMLLRFEPEALDGRSARRWLPVQRRGLEDRWHALRCAVHAEQPSHPHDQAGQSDAAGP